MDLTLCAVPKPFTGESAQIQENALASWSALEPRPRMVLVGDEDGVAAAAARHAAEHVPDVDRNELGTPLLPSVLAAAEARAGAGTVCFVNADILLFGDLLTALATVRTRFGRFLMSGRGWRLDPPAPNELGAARERALERAKLRSTASAEFFAYTPGLFGHIPAFALGRSGYDLWLLWRARELGVAVVDASRDVVAVHQDHGYGHIEGGHDTAHRGLEAMRNRDLREGLRNLDSLRDARYRLAGGRIRRNPLSIARMHHHAWMVKRFIEGPGRGRFSPR